MQTCLDAVLGYRHSVVVAVVTLAAGQSRGLDAVFQRNPRIVAHTTGLTSQLRELQQAIAGNNRRDGAFGSGGNIAFESANELVGFSYRSLQEHYMATLMAEKCAIAEGVSDAEASAFRSRVRRDIRDFNELARGQQVQGERQVFTKHLLCTAASLPFLMRMWRQ